MWVKHTCIYTKFINFFNLSERMVVNSLVAGLTRIEANA